MSEQAGNRIANRIVIIGAGQAAAQAVETLHKRGHSGPITLIGDEELLPYQRPPLSKKYLAGALDRDRLLIRHLAHYAEHGVELRLGTTAVRLDRPRRRVEMADGSAVEYDQLLLATGSRPRQLPMAGAGRAGVHYLRSIADVDRLRPELITGRRAVIIGGGYIGLEVAATCCEAGLTVTVIESADRVMARVVSPVVSQFYEAEHARRGVQILCNASLVPEEGTDLFVDDVAAGDLTLVVRSTSSTNKSVPSSIRADFVLIAIGVEPTDGLARDAGLACENGIVVDEYCRTSDEHIWAAGDCTRHPSIHYGTRVRLESVDNAFEQGTSAALNMLGIATVHDKVPWFWSDQFDLKMVIVGLATGHDEIVVRGDPASRAFSVCYLRNGELIAVETVNNTKDQMAARKLIAARARPQRARLADPTVPLKETPVESA